jgi:hypothetical protein
MDPVEKRFCKLLILILKSQMTIILNEDWITLEHLRYKRIIKRDRHLQKLIK